MKIILLFIGIVMSQLAFSQVSTKELGVEPIKSESSNKKRHALILGNADYQYISSLPVCLNDVDSMVNKLTDFGFSITTDKNLDYTRMKDLIERFIGGVDINTEVLIYYSGHGLHVALDDYLIPVEYDINCANYYAIENKAVSLQSIINALKAKGVNNSVIILDACRNISGNCEAQCFGESIRAETLENFAVFFSSNNCERSGFDSRNPDNSFFSKGLLYALRIPQLSLGKVFEIAYSQTKNITRQLNREQTPVARLQSGGIVINNMTFEAGRSQSRCLSFEDTPTLYRSTGVFRRVYDNHTVSLGMSRIQAQNNALSLLGGRVASELENFNSYMNGLDIRNNQAIETYKADISGKASSSYSISNGKPVCEEEFKGDYYYTLEIPKKDVCNLAKATAMSVVQSNSSYDRGSKKEILQIINTHFSNCQ